MTAPKRTRRAAPKASPSALHERLVMLAAIARSLGLRRFDLGFVDDALVDAVAAVSGAAQRKVVVLPSAISPGPAGAWREASAEIDGVSVRAQSGYRDASDEEIAAEQARRDAREPRAVAS